MDTPELPKGEENRFPGSRQARYLLVLSVVALCIVIIVFEFNMWPLVYILPVLLVLSLIIAVQLARAGTAAAPALAVIAGVVWILGGVAFDIGATIIQTPDLRQETNPIARSLLDSGHPVSFVFGYGAVAQSLYALMLC